MTMTKLENTLGEISKRINVAEGSITKLDVGALE